MRDRREYSPVPHIQELSALVGMGLSLQKTLPLQIILRQKQVGVALLLWNVDLQTH